MFPLVQRKGEIREDTGIAPIDCGMLNIKDGASVDPRARFFDRNADRSSSGRRPTDFFPGAARLFETGARQRVYRAMQVLRGLIGDRKYRPTN